MAEKVLNRPTKGDATRAALMRAGMRIFGEQGYLNAKTSQVAALAGKSAGLLYTYFENKKALLSAMLDALDIDMNYLGFNDPKVPARNWDFALKDYWEVYRNHWPALVAFRDAALVDATFKSRYAQFRARGRARLAEVIRINQSQEEAPAFAPEFAAVALSEVVDGIALYWFQHRAVADLPDADEADAFATIVKIFDYILGAPDPGSSVADISTLSL